MPRTLGMTGLGLLLTVLLAGCASRLPTAEAAATAALVGPRPVETELVPVVAEAPRLTRGVLTSEEMRRAAEACGEAEEECFRRHTLEAFFGYTFERGNGGQTIGLDYHYHLSERFGLTVFGDYVGGDIDAFAFGAGLWIEPLEGLKLVTAPGVDLEPEESEEGHGEGEEAPPERPRKTVEFLWRFGATYDIEIGRGWAVGAGAYLDLITPGKQAYVVGLSISKSF